MESSTRAFIVLMVVVVIAVVLAVLFSGGADVDEPSKLPDGPDGGDAASRTARPGLPPDEGPSTATRTPRVKEQKLYGIVKDAEGAPVEGAQVYLFPAQRRLPGVELEEDEAARREVVADLFQFYPEDAKALRPLGMKVTEVEPEVPLDDTSTDEKGEFTFPSPPLGKVRVYAEKGALASAMISTNSRGRVTLVVKGAAILKGRVRSEDDGRMVEGATIRLDSGSRPLTTVTGEGGTFEFKGLPASPVTVLAFHPDYAGALKRALLRPDQVTEVSISMSRGLQLIVRVTGEDADGENEEPVAGATVAAYRIEDQGYVLGEASSNGTAVFEGLPPGTYLVNGRAKGYLPAGEEKVPLQADREWDLVLEKAVYTTILVLDDRDVPLPGAELWTSNIDEEFEEGVSKKVGETNRDGEFPFPFDWDGKEAALFVVKDGFGMGYVVPDDPSEGGVFKVTLKRGRLLRGRVTDDSGGPVAGAMIYIEGTPDDFEEEDLYATLYTNANGEYRFPFLPPGDIWIEVSAEGYDGDDAEIETGSTRQEFVKNFQLEKD
ncbi:MAG: carboxypeptidase regulatory-like domain-containing protein [Planctomycetota bacterium]|jgi:hypothetical protein